MKTFFCSVIGSVIGVAILSSSIANAQVWLKDRAASEGPGVKAGNFEVHPGIGSEVGYDTNWFLRSSSTDQNALNGSGNGLPVLGLAALRITPSLSLSTLSGDRMSGAAGAPPMFKFRATGAATYREFLSGEYGNQRNTSGAGSLDLQIAPSQPLNGTIGAGYLRSVNATASGDPNLAFVRNDALFNGDIGYSPGGGTLEIRAGYRGRLSFFDNQESANQTENTAVGRARWLFRPRNALFIDAAYGVLGYDKNTSDTRNLAPMRLKMGTSGLITPRIGILLAAGYGSSGVQPGPGPTPGDFASFIGQGEIRYFLDAAALPDASNADAASSNALALGFLRDFSPSMLGSVMSLTRGYLRATYLWQGKVYSSIEGGVSSIGFNGLSFTSGESVGSVGAVRSAAFTNLRPDFTVFSEYRISNTIGINGTFKYASNRGDVTLKQNLTQPGFVDLNWTRAEAYIGIRYSL